ncbi:MAG: pseudouridine synthase [Candidatus Izemoplasmataceae bacterium]|jgi:23S rRNA pseudouridine2605 synthase
MERLQKVIASSGLCSRRKAEELITAGKVQVNGQKVTELGTKVTKNDEVTVNGVPIKKETPVYYVLYKPEGYVSTTSDEKNRRTVIDLVDTSLRVFPVGRLDYDTSGVLLLTNDGDFTNLMIHPKSGIEKEYEVTLKGFLRKESSKKLEKGIVIDGMKTKRARIKNVVYNKERETTKLTVIITEGKYHQVKRMFEMFDHEVIKLKRVRFGTITLKNMHKGEVRLLKPHEYKQLIVLTEKQKQQNQ